MAEEKQELLTDPRSTRELIEEAILLDPLEERHWQILRTLHHRATREELEAAIELCNGDSTAGKVLGCDILGGIGDPERPFLDESVPVLCEMLEREKDADVLISAFHALGFLHPDDERALKLLPVLGDHPDPWVREEFARSLADWEENPIALNTLIKLTIDDHRHVRRCATFGLGVMVDADTPEIREALLRRMDDEDPRTRGSALYGLGLRQDRRAVEPIIRDLQTVSDATEYAIQAAEYMADPRLCPALAALHGNPDVDPDDLGEALCACQCRDG